MKRLLLLCLSAAFISPGLVSAQIKDSLGNECLVPAAESAFSQYMDRRTSTKGYRMTFVAVPLILGGAVVSLYDTDFRRLRNGYVKSFHHDYDDYLQYAPAALLVGMKACGVESRSSWGRMLVSDAFSAGLMAAAVNSLKYSFRVMRPDGSTRNSFPSGHTATAFMTATMLHKEYGHRSPWYSIGGYTLATLTGVTRQLNNRHWMSDVMVGAGIGILATEFGYFLADLIFKEKGLRVHDTYVVFDRYRHPSFVGFSVGLTVIPGSYAPYRGMHTDFKVGPTVGVQGAWFASPYVGVGGRFAVTNLEMNVNGVPQNDEFECCSVTAGPYFSYPLSARWRIGSKLLCGYEHYKPYSTSGYRIEGRGGFTIGTGFSSTYLVNRNLGVRFTTDYDVAPPLVSSSCEVMHKLTMGMEISAMF